MELRADNLAFKPLQFPQVETQAEVSYRILVVDDSEASAKTLGWTLEILGHQPQLAHMPQQAMEIARSFLPHIILMDIGLPGMDGYEVCKRLLQEKAFQNTLFIAQTGWGNETHLQRSREAGFHHHMVKPIKMDELEKIINNAASHFNAQDIN